MTSSNSSSTNDAQACQSNNIHNHKTFTQSQLNNNFHNNNHHHQSHNYHDLYNNNHTHSQTSSTTVPVIKKTSHHQNNNSTTSPLKNGTLVLDRLLESLSIKEDSDEPITKKDATNQRQSSSPHSSTPTSHFLEANNNHIEPKSPIERFNGYQMAMMRRKPTRTPELSDVIADLTDFDQTETMRRESSNSPKINGGGPIKRLTSESENSSSISPSLSEKSNGVSWSDQVEFLAISSFVLSIVKDL